MLQLNFSYQYNPIFETLCQVQGQNVQMHITSVTGHLMEVEFAEPFGRKWNACKPLDLFELPIVKRVKESNRDLKMQLEAEARKCQWLILWLDCDAEGENIAFEVMEVIINTWVKMDLQFLLQDSKFNFLQF